MCKLTGVRFSILKSLTNNQLLGWSKSKAFTDNKIDMTETLKFALGRAENIVGKGENVFSPLPTMFSKGCFLRFSKKLDCVMKNKGFIKGTKRLY